MCTIGYNKKLNLLFKNRDKNDPTEEVFVLNPKVIGVKTEGADYFSAGINRHGCAFVSSAVNSSLWTSLVIQGKLAEASSQLKKETKGLTLPSVIASACLPSVASVEELADKILHSGKRYRAYNLLLADKVRAVHLELHDDQSHVSWIDEAAVVTNHFPHLAYGPKKSEEYPSSFERFLFVSAFINDLISMEDLFSVLKPSTQDGKNPLWREKDFPTVSSTVLDLDADAIYYGSSRTDEYKRIAGTIPPKGAERTFIEMSRYIDLPTYHKIERGHPFYEEMLEEMSCQIVSYYREKNNGSGTLKTLEIGAGTGLYTLELAKKDFLAVECLDIDEKCCEILKSHALSSVYNVILGDAVTYCKPHNYDLVISTFAHDHIHYDKRFTFARNIYNNLKKGGRYIMGGEILSYYSNDRERKKALFRYHNYIIEKALEHDRVQLSELENNALKSGLDMVGDFKRYEGMFEEEMRSAGFKLVSKKKIGPAERDDVGGVFVYVYEK